MHLSILKFSIFALFLGASDAIAAPKGSDHRWGCEVVKKALTENEIYDYQADIAALRKGAQVICPLKGKELAERSALESSANKCLGGKKEELISELQAYWSGIENSCLARPAFLSTYEKVCERFYGNEIMGYESLAYGSQEREKRYWANELRLGYFGRVLGGVEKRLDKLKQETNEAASGKDPFSKAIQEIESRLELLPELASLRSSFIAQEEELEKQVEQCKKEKDCQVSEEQKKQLADWKERISACGKVTEWMAGYQKKSLPTKRAQRDSLAANLQEVEKAIGFTLGDLKEGKEEMAKRWLQAVELAREENPKFLEPQYPGIPSTALKQIGIFGTSFYYVAQEHDHGEVKSKAVVDPNGKTLSKVSRRFYKKIALEGTAQLVDSRVINVYGRTKGQNRYVVVGEKAPYGYGNSKKYPLEPFRSLAVDPKVIPIGTELYIPEFYGMRYMDPYGNYRLHDGRFRAVDVGGAIKGNRIDMFTGVGDQSYFHRAHGKPHGAQVGVFLLEKAK